MKRRTAMVWLGGLFWLCVSSAIAFGTVDMSAVGRSGRQASAIPAEVPVAATRVPRPAGNQIFDYWVNRPRQIQLSLPSVQARRGDPIFALTPEGDWVQAGYLLSTNDALSATSATAIWHTDEVRPEDLQFEACRNQGRFADILRMMFPVEKRERIEEIIRDSIERDASAITSAMRPVITKSMSDSLPVVDRAIRESIARHRPEIETVGERYRETVLEDRLVPLLKDEVLPIVKFHAQPLAEQIGKELWDRASVWRFGWRYLYDRTPLPERDLVRQEWDRFVAEEAIPVLESHTDDMLVVQQMILRDVSQNDRVREELSIIATEISRDEELRKVVTTILRESIVENRQLRQVWIDNWQSEEAKAALKIAGDRLEPVVRRIGDEIFGSRETGISPSFARVLRNQILGKDKRWLIAVPNPSDKDQEGESNGVFEVTIGRDDLPFPLIIMAGKDEPF